MAGKPRAALYGRVSTAEQNAGLQLDELRQVSAQRGWDVVGEYVDHAISGAKDRRPELDRLSADVHRGQVDLIAVWKFDRFARSVRHLVTALDEFRARGIDFVSVRDAIDTSTPGGRFHFQIIAAVAELERELIRERVSAGLAAAKRRGKHVGRPRRSFDVDRAQNLIATGVPLSETARQCGVSPRTLRRQLAEAGQNPLAIEPAEAGEITGDMAPARKAGER